MHMPFVLVCERCGDIGGMSGMLIMFHIFSLQLGILQKNTNKHLQLIDFVLEFQKTLQCIARVT